MTEDTKLAYDANHVFREGYDRGYHDAIKEMREGMMHTLFLGQNLINKTASMARKMMIDDEVRRNKDGD